MYRSNEIDYLKYLRTKEVIVFGAGIKGKRGYYGLVRGGY